MIYALRNARTNLNVGDAESGNEMHADLHSKMYLLTLLQVSCALHSGFGRLCDI